MDLLGWTKLELTSFFEQTLISLMGLPEKTEITLTALKTDLQTVWQTYQGFRRNNEQTHYKVAWGNRPVLYENLCHK